MLPLSKVLGTENISDLMTNRMPTAIISAYMKRMGLQYVKRRSDIAQQLHAITLQGLHDKIQIDKSGHGVGSRVHGVGRELRLQGARTSCKDSICKAAGSKSVNSRREPFKTDGTTSYDQPVEAVVCTTSHHATVAFRRLCQGGRTSRSVFIRTRGCLEESAVIGRACITDHADRCSHR